MACASALLTRQPGRGVVRVVRRFGQPLFPGQAVRRAAHHRRFALETANGRILHVVPDVLYGRLAVVQRFAHVRHFRKQAFLADFVCKPNETNTSREQHVYTASVIVVPSETGVPRMISSREKKSNQIVTLVRVKKIK